MSLIRFSGSFQGTSNIRSLCNVLFSFKKRKFVRPVRRYGDRVSGFWEYLVYDGKYGLFSYDSWSKSEPPISFEISLVSLSLEENSYRVDKLKSVKIYTHKNNEILELLRMHGYFKFLSVVDDFIRCLPSYHVRPDVLGLSEKIYDEDTVKEMLEFLEKFNSDEMYYNMDVE